MSGGRRKFAYVAVAAMLLALMLGPVRILGQLFSPDLVTPIPPGRSYFRFKAQYTVLATGEVVKFDLVRPCFSVMGRDMAGDSVGLPPSNPSGYFNGVNVFPKVTSDHHLIVLWVPRACDGETTANGRVQADLLPYIVWFENADDMAYGWQYVSEDAYKSPLATVRFDGATIESADQADFLAWQRRAPADFRPSKWVQSPYGFSFEELHTNSLAVSCWGVRRFTLPDQIRSFADAAWPPEHPRFWMVPLQQQKRTPDQNTLYRSIWANESLQYRFNDGNPAGVLSYGFDGGHALQSVPTRLDGALDSPKARPPDFFPLVSSPYGVPFVTPERMAASNLYFDVDTRPEMRGFFTCYDETWIPDALKKNVLGDITHRQVAWRIDGESVVDQIHVPPTASGIFSPNRFFELDKFAYEGAENLW